MRRFGPLVGTLLVAAVMWHLFWIYTNGWGAVRNSPEGHDFATFYYAAHTAWGGGDPYDSSALAAAARGKGSARRATGEAGPPASSMRLGTLRPAMRQHLKGRLAKTKHRRPPHEPAPYPFVYPPAFLLGMAWVLPLKLATAYRAWFIIDELMLWIAVGVLWLWWRRLGAMIGAALIIAACFNDAVLASHAWGQMNLPTLAMALAGAWQAEEGRRAQSRGRMLLGGALLGAACMIKMSPALLVGWLLLRRNHLAAGAALGCAAALSLAATLVFGTAIGVHFFFEVLPGMAAGDYNGLAIAIDYWGNHSVAGLLQAAIAHHGHALSPLAGRLMWLWQVALLGAVGLCCWRRRVEDQLARHAQLAAVAVTTLLLPPYTFEHHLVWLIPAVALSAEALRRGRLASRGWSVGLAAAWTVVALPRAVLEHVAHWDRQYPLVDWLLRASKLLAMMVLLLAMLRLMVPRR